ncbi:unnamed protein product [Dibothriocephalus latus]|uniref:Uncharacterized protein n=1 Tax=Dibothriocephalus latus TaxID=60516 RepID=A0A3P6TTB0_DIBLA|nr:unnamed protein product [Dibothriocephalus latus]
MRRLRIARWYRREQRCEENVEVEQENVASGERSRTNDISRLFSRLGRKTGWRANTSNNQKQERPESALGWMRNTIRSCRPVLRSERPLEERWAPNSSLEQSRTFEPYKILEESFATEDLSGASDIIDIQFIISDNLLTEAWTVTKEPTPMAEGQGARLIRPRARRLREISSVNWRSAGQGVRESVGTQGDLESHSLTTTEFMPSYQGPERIESPDEDAQERLSPTFRSIQSCNPRPRPRCSTRPLDASTTPMRSYHPMYEPAQRPHICRRSKALRAPISPISREKHHWHHYSPTQVRKTARLCRAEPLSSPKCRNKQLRSPVYIKFQSNKNAGINPETVIEYTQSTSRAHAVAQVKCLQKAYTAATVNGICYAVCRGKRRLQAERRCLSMATLDRKHRRSFKRSPALALPLFVPDWQMSSTETDTCDPLVPSSSHGTSGKACLYVEKYTQYEDIKMQGDGSRSYSQLVEIKVGDKRPQRGHKCTLGRAPASGVKRQNQATSYNEADSALEPVKSGQEMHRSVYWMYVPLKPVDSQHSLECRCRRDLQVCTCTADCEKTQTCEARLWVLEDLGGPAYVRGVAADLRAQANPF